MASPETWSKVRNFKPNSVTDKFGDPYQISDELILRLDDFRNFLGIPIFITSGVRRSKAKSYHSSIIKDGFQAGYCAADIVIPRYQYSPFDLIMDATRFGFNGIGYYPHWKFQGETVGGLHLDCRPMQFDDNDTLDYRQNRWMGVLENGKQIYIPLTFANMMKHYRPKEPIDNGLH